MTSRDRSSYEDSDGCANTRQSSLTFPLSASIETRTRQICSIRQIEEYVPRKVLSKYCFVWDEFESHSDPDTRLSSWIPIFPLSEIPRIEMCGQSDSEERVPPSAREWPSSIGGVNGEHHHPDSDDHAELQHTFSELYHIWTEHEHGINGMLSIRQLDALWGKRWRLHLPVPFDGVYENRRVIAECIRQFLDVRRPTAAFSTSNTGTFSARQHDLETDYQIISVFRFLYDNVPREFVTPIEKLGEYLNQGDIRKELCEFWKFCLEYTVLYDPIN